MNYKISYKIYIFKWYHIVDPAFRLNAFPTWWRARFLIWKIDFIWLRKLALSRHLFCFILKGKQNQKEKL